MESVTNSRFYMWRGVVAMAHADGVVTPQELNFINDYVRDIDFSQEQLNVIGEDLRTPQKVQTMFSAIENIQDKKDFFALARALSWSDGDYDAQERLIIEQLEQDTLSEDLSILHESREFLNKVELSDSQWQHQAAKKRNMLGFISGLRAQATA